VLRSDNPGAPPDGFIVLDSDGTVVHRWFEPLEPSAWTVQGSWGTFEESQSATVADTRAGANQKGLLLGINMVFGGVALIGMALHARQSKGGLMAVSRWGGI
jgi:hypothetical protein